MRYSAEHKEETRRKLLDAAARRFRALGYDGLGVDGLAKEAGVTNGAFYGNFASKAEAFRVVVAAGLDELRQGVERFRAENGEEWLQAFAEFYLSDPKLNCPEKTCPLPAFAPEVARAPRETQEVFQAELLRVADAVAEGLDPETPAAARGRAWAILALLAGGVLLARAAPDAALSEEISEAVRQATLESAASEG